MAGRIGRGRVVGLIGAAVLAVQPAAAPGAPVSDDAARIDALVAMMAAMRPESREAAARTREAYRDELDTAFADRPDLISSLEDGELARLPEPANRFNLRLRLAGAHPIAERDLVYQPLYLAARPAAVGALLAVAARVRSGPVEVTSLVRHHEYQRQLRKGNANARTEVPTHTMGLAFDISVLNSPLQTAREIRDVLRAMAADGDLFVVAETHQLVFHVVPAPDRLTFFAALYEAVMALRPPLSDVVVATALDSAAADAGL